MSNPILDTFFEETEELLESLAEGLESMQGAAFDKETVNSVFRAVHSIKGGAGAFKLTDLVNFAHSFETVMDAVRSETLALTPQIMHTLMRSADCLADLVDAARSGRTISEEVTSGFLTALQACLGEDEIEAVDAWDNFEFNAVTLDIEPIDLDTSTISPAETPAMAEKDQVQIGFRIEFRPHAALFTNGHEPALLFAALGDLGQMSSHIDLTRLAEWSDFNPTEPRLSWTVDLRTDESEITVQEVFEFVHGLCDLTIKPLRGTVATAIIEERSIGNAAQDKVNAGLVQSGPASETAVPSPQAALAVSQAAMTASVTIAAKAKAERNEDGSDAKAPKATLRVDLDRVRQADQRSG